MEQNTDLVKSKQPEVIEKFNFFNPDHFNTMQRVAQLFATSELVPDMYKISANNPKEKAVANCIIAIDMANRIGAGILMVMQNLIVIYGRPSWSSKFLISTVNTCGRFEPLRYKFEDLGEITNVEYTEYEWSGGKKQAVTKAFKGPIKNISCYAYSISKNNEEPLEGSPISIEMAIKEGWYTKAGSKWKTMPKQMLMYRAASFWTNAYAPDLSMGMKTEDEVRDIEEASFEDIVENEVKKEIAQNANKEPIDIKPEPKPETKTESKPEVKPEAEKPESKNTKKQPQEDMFGKGPGF